MIIETPRGEILAWSPDRGRLTVILCFLPFANNRTNCCHLLTKLLGDGLVAIPALCSLQSCPDIFGQLFVLAMVESLESDWLIAPVDRCLITGNKLRLGAFDVPLWDCSLSQLLTCRKDTWEPEILLIDRGSNTYFHSLKCKTFFEIHFSGLFCCFILSLTVQINNIIDCSFFVSGQRTKSAGDQYFFSPLYLTNVSYISK